MTQETLNVAPTLWPQIPLCLHPFTLPIPYRFPTGTDCSRHLCLIHTSHMAPAHTYSNYFQIAQWTVQFSHSCLTLCDPMDCSTPGLPVHHLLPESTHWCPLSWWCHATISSSVVPFSSCLQYFLASGSFTMNQFFTSGGQSIRMSASASVLPKNISGNVPLVSLIFLKRSLVFPILLFSSICIDHWGRLSYLLAILWNSASKWCIFPFLICL